MLSKKEKDTSLTNVKIGTIIGPGAVFDGNLTAPETIRIDGALNGNCTCEGNLILGKDGVIVGNIHVKNATLSGKVTGDIVVQGKLELFSTAKVAGDITASSLVIDEHACYDGRCTMSNDSIPSASPKENQKQEKDTDSTDNKANHK